MVSSDDEGRSKRGGSIQLKDGGQRFRQRMRHEARNYIRFRTLESPVSNLDYKTLGDARKIRRLSLFVLYSSGIKKPAETRVGVASPDGRD
jgi:hypothetical protein